MLLHLFQLLIKYISAIVFRPHTVTPLSKQLLEFPGKHKIPYELEQVISFQPSPWTLEQTLTLFPSTGLLAARAGDPIH